MQIVIDIPEEVKHKIYNYGLSLCPSDKDQLVRAIVNGTPLPKGHGRLIILSEDIVKREQIPLSFSCQKWISEVGLSNATIDIIEADMESED